MKKERRGGELRRRRRRRSRNEKKNLKSKISCEELRIRDLRKFNLYFIFSLLTVPDCYHYYPIAAAATTNTSSFLSSSGPSSWEVQGPFHCFFSTKESCDLESCASTFKLKSKMASPGDDLMDLSNHDASKQHTAAVTRDYISQPRISMYLRMFRNERSEHCFVFFWFNHLISCHAFTDDKPFTF